MLKLADHLGRVAVLSVATGLLLTQFDIQAHDLVRDMGAAPDLMLDGIQRGAAWLAPNLVAGSLVVAPIWLVIWLFRPPAG